MEYHFRAFSGTAQLKCLWIKSWYLPPATLWLYLLALTAVPKGKDFFFCKTCMSVYVRQQSFFFCETCVCESECVCVCVCVCVLSLIHI